MITSPRQRSAFDVPARLCSLAALTLVFLTSSARGDDSIAQHRVSVFGEGALALIDLVTDGHGPNTGYKGLGAGANYMFGRRWARVGLGLRYVAVLGGGRKWPTFEPETAHVVTLPLLGSLVIPVSESGDELHFVAGIGPSFGWIVGQDPQYVEGGSTLHISGVTLEAMLGYAHPLSATIDFVGEVGVWLGPVDATNGLIYYKDAAGVYAGIPLRLGVRWKL